jgi:hypothetical protein
MRNFISWSAFFHAVSHDHKISFIDIIDLELSYQIKRVGGIFAVLCHSPKEWHKLSFVVVNIFVSLVQEIVENLKTNNEIEMILTSPKPSTYFLPILLKKV